MFKSKIAGLRGKLKRSFRMMSDSYIVLNYPEKFRELNNVKPNTYANRDKSKTAQELLRADKFCYWTADNGTSIDEQYPVVIDFENDLLNLGDTLSEPDLLGLIRVAADDMRNGKCHFPFEDMLINVGGCVTPDSQVLEDVCVRIRNVTKNYVIDVGEQLDKMIEISMMHTISDNDYEYSNAQHDFYMASCKPQIIELFEDEVILEQNLLWEDKILDFLYFGIDRNKIENLNDVARTSMMTIVVLFLFFYSLL